MNREATPDTHVAPPQATETELFVTTLPTPDLWAAIHAERNALADDLSELDDEAWATPSLCAGWTVEDVVAHLTAGATIGRFRWLVSMVRARFDDHRHNERWIDRHRGVTPVDTLARFRDIVDSATAPSGHTEAWLGEVIVHGGDIRRPLGIDHRPPVPATTAVAGFFARRDFTVASATAIDGLQLRADDGPFHVGDGPLVTGTTVALVMAMAGRSAFLADLDGPGVAELRQRHHSSMST
jgi:uncharacterized protein (TIGR03083 family)